MSSMNRTIATPAEVSMKTSISLTTVALLIGSAIALESHGEETRNLDFEFSCPGGGQVIAQGSWNPVNGETHFSTQVEQCVLNDGSTVDGSGAADGTFLPTYEANPETRELTITGYEVDLQSQLDLDRLGTENESLGSYTVTRTIVGTYDLNAQILDGQITTKRQGSNLKFPLAEMFVPAISQTDTP